MKLAEIIWKLVSCLCICILNDDERLFGKC